VDATNIMTVDEKEKKAGLESAPATVAAPKDVDNEDAVQSASTVKVDPELDEGYRKEQKALGTFTINTAEQILNTFSRTDIMHYPDRIKDRDQGMLQNRENVQGKTEERDAAAQVMGSVCEIPETDDPIAFKAKEKSCNMQKEVLAEKEAELQAAQKILDERTAKIDTEVRAAQAQQQKEIDREAMQTASSGNEKTIKSVPHDVHQLKVETPQGDVNDPFSMDCAETASRIDAQKPGVAQHLTPHLDSSADIAGVHFTESDESDPDVMAPADGEDNDAPAFFLQMHRGGRNLRVPKYV